jgi:hypothetical protein
MGMIVLPFGHSGVGIAQAGSIPALCPYFSGHHEQAVSWIRKSATREQHGKSIWACKIKGRRVHE